MCSSSFGNSLGNFMARPFRKHVELKQKISNAMGNPRGINNWVRIQREGVKNDSTLLGDNSKYDRNPTPRKRTVLGGD